MQYKIGPGDKASASLTVANHKLVDASNNVQYTTTSNIGPAFESTYQKDYKGISFPPLPLGNWPLPHIAWLLAIVHFYLITTKQKELFQMD